jgi:CDP-glycerol glycerophosphotransferase (TagB/SpsB family)
MLNNYENYNMTNFFKTEVSLYPLYVSFTGHFVQASLEKNKLKNNKLNLFNIIGLIYKIIRDTLLNSLKNLIENHKTDVLFISRYRPKCNIDENRDYLFDEIIKLIGDEYSCNFISTSSLKKKYSHKEIGDFNILDNLSLEIIFKSLYISIRLLIAYKYLRIKTKNFNILYNLINFRRLFITCLKNHCLERYLNFFNPKIVVVNEDTTFKIKPKNFTGKWIVVQSAYRAEINNHLQNLWHSKFIREKEKMDLYCIGGSYFNNDNKYTVDKKNIVITGQPRFDSLFFSNSKRNKFNFKKKFNTDDLNIIWATQTHGLNKFENEKNLFAMRDLLNNIHNINLLIKLHPAEPQKNTIYSKLEENFKNCIIINNKHPLSNLSNLLTCSDILITKNSTIAIEACLMDMDIIIVDYLNKLDNTYIKDGVAIGAFNQVDVKYKVKELLSNNKKRKKLSANRKMMNYQYNYLNDGKACLRISNIIKELIENC